MKTKQELRQSLESKAKQFWYDFNKNAWAGHKLSEEEITESLERTSITGLGIMTSPKRKTDQNYEYYIGAFQNIDQEYEHKEVLLHFFDESCFNKIKHSRHPSISGEYFINEQILSDIDVEISEKAS